MLKIILKKPNTLNLNSKYKVENKSNMDSKEVNNIMIFRLSQGKGLNRQVNMAIGLCNIIPDSVASISSDLRPALLLWSSCCKAS